MAQSSRWDRLQKDQVAIQQQKTRKKAVSSRTKRKTAFVLGGWRVFRRLKSLGAWFCAGQTELAHCNII